MIPLRDVAAQAHLLGASQVVACLKIINDVLRELRADADAVLCAVDEEERCYVAAETQASIMEIWQTIVAAHASGNAIRPSTPSCAPPYAIEPAAPKLVRLDQTDDERAAG